MSLLKKICGKWYSDGEAIERHVFEMEVVFERLTVAGQDLDQNLQVANGSSKSSRIGQHVNDGTVDQSR